MKIAVIAGEGKDPSSSLTKAICERLLRLDAVVLANIRLQHTLGLEAVRYLDPEELYTSADLIISIGGDGAILHAAGRALERQTPILGVNAGRLGFMTSLEVNELGSLERLVCGDYEIDSRMMLEITISGNGGTHYALNDAVISKGERSRIIDIHIECDEKPVCSYRADGIIVSTPTGSTAYSLSAGGPVVDPTLESIGVTPICPHSLISRTILFDPKSRIRVNLENLEGKDVFLTVDGQDIAALGKEDRIEIIRSSRKTKLVKLKDNSFYEILSTKMNERGL